MLDWKNMLYRSFVFWAIFSVVCGVLYTACITGIAQVFFTKQADGSIIKINGVTYGSSLLGQEYNDMTHMWGRVIQADTTTFTDKSGNAVYYAWPSNLSTTSDALKVSVEKRVEMLKQADPTMDQTKIPVDLVTSSASGLDPHISKAAAQYQIDRLVKSTGKTKEEIQEIINKYTTKPFLGIFGEPVVNVLEVNLALDGIL